MDESAPATGKFAVFGGIAAVLFRVYCVYLASGFYSGGSQLHGVVTFLLAVFIIVGGVLRVRTAVRARPTSKTGEASSPPS